METVNIAEKLALFTDHYHPRIIGALNGQHVKVVKVLGSFTWHHHDNEDELFLVLDGELIMQFRDKNCIVKKGEFIIVPRGVEHCPKAEIETSILLFEPDTTLNTGNTINEFTHQKLEKI